MHTRNTRSNYDIWNICWRENPFNNTSKYKNIIIGIKIRKNIFILFFLFINLQFAYYNSQISVGSVN